jgi:hypothetical protein
MRKNWSGSFVPGEPPMPAVEIDLLLRVIDQAFDHKSWHGAGLRGSIRGLSAAQAAWRPAPGRHNIAEHVLHAAYWKYTVRRRLREEGRGAFPLKGSNWFPRGDELTEGRWKADLRLLVEAHTALRQSIASCDAAKLDTNLPDQAVTPFGLISGIAAHDLYHAGQIQLIKRLMNGSARVAAPRPAPADPAGS